MTTDWHEKYKAEVEKRIKSVNIWKEQYSILQKKHEQCSQQINACSNKLIELNHEYKSAISAFVNLIELNNSKYLGYARKIADHAMILGISLNLGPEVANDLYYAGLVHEIGQLSLDKDICNKSILSLSFDEKEYLKQMPWHSHMSLIPLTLLKNASNIILQHQEKLDGSGYPRGIKADDISFPAKVLGVVVDYHKISYNRFFLYNVDSDKAGLFLKEQRDIWYDKKVVDMFLQILNLEKNQLMRNEHHVTSRIAIPGMVLSRAIYTERGMLLLPKHHILTEDNIAALLKIEEKYDETLNIFVKQGIQRKYDD